MIELSIWPDPTSSADPEIPTMRKVVRFMDLRVTAEARRQYLQAIDQILASGIILNGPQLEMFERDVASYCGTIDAVGVASGSAALYLALKCLGIGPDDEVILPALSFVGTANAVVAVGARPVFVDIRDDLLIDPAAVEPAITGKTKAIMPVHFTGNVCDMEALAAIAQRGSIDIVEDAAPAFGAMRGNRMAGTTGRLGCFSMNPMKVLGAVGEAGVIAVQSEPLASQLRELRYHGVRDKEICINASTNARLDTIQAAILAIRLRSLDRSLNRRAAIAERYTAQLSGVVQVPRPPPNVRHAWYNYTVLCDRRAELARALQVEGIESRVYHSRLMPEHPPHAVDLSAFPVGCKVVERILCLPMHEKLHDDEVDRVAEVIVRFYGKS
jgi:dTDP-4-amino-4,6-dideoxygalactose transaminase